MEFYSTVASIPELRHLKPGERRRLWSWACSKAFLRPRGLVGFICILACIGVCNFAGRALAPGTFLGLWIWPAVGAGLGAFFAWIFWVAEAREILRGG